MTIHDLCKKHFGLTLPINLPALKHAYRQAAKKLHTDTSGSDTKAAFIEMQKAYELLCKCPGAFTEAEKEFCYTEEGTPLSDLGRGLGMRNGKPCQKCKGVGYRKEQAWRLVPKPTPEVFHIQGATPTPCRRCAALQSTLGCHVCWGRFDRKLLTLYLICAACQGHGEIELFNPVLPKGLLSSY
jgi:hypothetical protein